MQSWGRSGIDKGEFNLPHNICCDDAGLVYVADRENHRVQVFDGNGNFETEWGHLHRPSGLWVDLQPDGLSYVAESYPGFPFSQNAPNLGPRVSIASRAGSVLARLNNEPSTPEICKFIRPHGIAIDSVGDIYVADLQRERYEGQRPLGGLKKLVKARPQTT